MEQKTLIDKKALKFLETYINNASPTGFEWEGQKMWMDYIKPYVDEFYSDTYGTAVGIINPKANYKVVIEAHADEISWMVNYIRDDGMIFVVPNGGSDYQIATSKTVVIHTKKGSIKGIFGWPAIQTREKNEEKSPEQDSIYIDIGCKSREEVLKMGIRAGNVITYDDQFFVLNNNKFVGRALDNRIGGFMIAQVARLLKENKVTLPFGLYLTNAVQEEVGTQGAAMIVQQLQPNVAIVTDVTHDTTTPRINQKKEGHCELEKGPVIFSAPSVHHKLQDLIIDTAVKNKIPFQHAASQKSTGTDTDAFAYKSGGVASALISLPLRYMHTTVEMVDRTDVENTIRLLYETLRNIKGKENFKYF